MKEHPLPKPYKTGIECGIPIVKTLLHPHIKQLIDKMRLFKGCYIGINDTGASLYIDSLPVLKISSQYLEGLKQVLADDVREYSDLTEYRLTEDRYKHIMAYYSYTK